VKSISLYFTLISGCAKVTKIINFI